MPFCQIITDFSVLIFLAIVIANLRLASKIQLNGQWLGRATSRNHDMTLEILYKDPFCLARQDFKNLAYFKIPTPPLLKLLIINLISLLPLASLLGQCVFSCINKLLARANSILGLLLRQKAALRYTTGDEMGTACDLTPTRAQFFHLPGSGKPFDPPPAPRLPKGIRR